MSSMGRTHLEEEEIFCPLSLYQGSVTQYFPLTHTDRHTHAHTHTHAHSGET